MNAEEFEIIRAEVDGLGLPFKLHHSGEVSHEGAYMGVYIYSEDHDYMGILADYCGVYWEADVVGHVGLKIREYGWRQTLWDGLEESMRNRNPVVAIQACLWLMALAGRHDDWVWPHHLS